MDWRERGNCTTENADELFEPGRKQRTEAIKICRFCPVQEECLRWALKHKIEWGVWGGLTERQRIKIIGKSGTKR